jgi:hypothetical protein
MRLLHRPETTILTHNPLNSFFLAKPFHICGLFVAHADLFSLEHHTIQRQMLPKETNPM